eukprot:s43_g26.t1
MRFLSLLAKPRVDVRRFLKAVTSCNVIVYDMHDADFEELELVVRMLQDLDGSGFGLAEFCRGINFASHDGVASGHQQLGFSHRTEMGLPPSTELPARAGALRSEEPHVGRSH